MFGGCRIFFSSAAALVWAVCAQANEAPRDFTLALSWQPAFCESAADRPECRQQASGRRDTRHFSLHGLWPNIDRNANGRLDADDNYCLPEPERSDIMRRSWRNLPAVTLSGAVRQDLDRVMPGTISGLERHQWAKHGTCSSFSQFDYFRIAIDRTEDLANTQFAGFVTSNIGAEILRRDLLESFEREFGGRSARALRLICARADNRMLLSEIRLLLRAQDIDRKLARETLAIPVRAASGNCPARFWIDSAD